MAKFPKGPVIRDTRPYAHHTHPASRLEIVSYGRPRNPTMAAKRAKIARERGPWYESAHWESYICPAHPPTIWRHKSRADWLKELYPWLDQE